MYEIHPEFEYYPNRVRIRVRIKVFSLTELNFFSSAKCRQLGFFAQGRRKLAFFRLRQVKLSFLHLGGRKMAFFRATVVCWLFFALDAFIAFLRL